MKPLHWAILLAILVLIGGVVFGVGGIFFAPLLGILVMIGVILWFMERKAEHKPPAE